MRKKSLSLILLLFVAVLMTVDITGAEKDSELYFKGLTLFESEKYEEALEVFDQILEIDSEDDFILGLKGIDLSKLGRYEEAIQAYDKALNIDQENAIIWKYKGDSLTELGKYEEAIQAYKNALKFDPENANTKITLEIAQKKLNETAETTGDVVDIAGAEKDSELYFKGLTLFESEKYEEALEVFDQILGIDSEDDFILGLKGIALSKLGRYEEAIQAYDKVLKINPDDVDAKESRDTIKQKLQQEPASNVQPGSQSSIQCQENSECGDHCCDSNEKCCKTKYGPMCYDPHTHLCRNGDLQTVWGESVIPVQYEGGVPGSSVQTKKNAGTGTM